MFLLVIGGSVYAACTWDVKISSVLGIVFSVRKYYMTCVNIRHEFSEKLSEK